MKNACLAAPASLKICLGTMTFGGQREIWQKIGQLDQAVANGLVPIAIDAGVNFFDTADVYSEGEAERMLGPALKDLGIARKDVIVATRVRGRIGCAHSTISFRPAKFAISAALT
jgi:aryl-alcohol dehydrogenase-like predicted oxidoreductase